MILVLTSVAISKTSQDGLNACIRIRSTSTTVTSTAATSNATELNYIMLYVISPLLAEVVCGLKPASTSSHAYEAKLCPDAIIVHHPS